MKGFTHFISGLAVTSCVPGVVEAAASGQPLYFILGGAAGLLPDTIDFKWIRFVYRYDVVVQPDPLALNAPLIADALAEAIDHAADSGRPWRIKLSTLSVGADAWQQYTVELDVPARKIRVAFGHVVDTGQKPVRKSTCTQREAIAEFKAPVRLDYEAAVAVDIFDGPIFEMHPDEHGVVTPLFIPWHRQGSHSLVVASVAGLLSAVIWDLRAGLVVTAAWSCHALEDQFGYLGSNLFWPFTKMRAAGLRRMHALDAFPNIAVAWCSISLIYWNLSTPVDGLAALPFLFYAVFVPLLAIRSVLPSTKEPSTGR